MKQLVSVNLTTRTATDWTPPELTFGESLTLALRFYKNTEGTPIDANLTINSLKASIGRVDARPAGGNFKIKIGSEPSSGANTTAALGFDIKASDLKAALNAVSAHSTYGDARVIFTDGSWLIFFGDQSQQVPLTVVDNALWPVSYGRINAWQMDGKWVHELRLTQAPVAFTSSHDIVLPPQPVVTRIQAGGANGDDKWNEIQQVYVPAEFRGAYLLKRGYLKTTLLSREDGPDTLQEALQALGAGCFKVTLPLSNKLTIEFVGDYAGAAQDLLVASVEQAPAGDLAFTLALDRAELAAMLRKQDSVTLPLEVRVVGTDEGGFTGELCALTLDVKILRPVIFPEMEEIPTLALLRPYSPKTYVPYGANNELVGQKYYRSTIGDGVQEEFVIATGLNSELVYVFARENISGGRQLVAGTDFSVTIDNDNQVTVTALTGPPAADAWEIVVLSALTVAQWAADLSVTVQQVIAGGGYPALPAYMDATEERLVALEALLPRAGAAGSTSGEKSLKFEYPDIGEILADVNVLDSEATISSQLIVVDASQPPVPPAGTELADDVDKAKAAAETAKTDPEALPANVLYRVTIPAVGKTATAGIPAVVENGVVTAPAVAATESDPAVWPVRTASLASAGKWPLLLPAVHDASVTDVTELPAASAGSVWRNTSGSDLLIPGGGGRKSQKVPNNGLFAHDGRAYYRVVAATGDYYHPYEMERELWRVLLGDEQFPVGGELSISGEVRTRMVGEFFDDDARNLGRVDIGGQYLLRCEAVPVAGSVVLGAVSEAVLLGQTRITLSPAMETFRWGLKIKREEAAMVSSWLAYRKAEAGGDFSLPAAIRLRLVAFDVDDAAGDPRGQIALVMPGTTLEIATL